MFCPKCGSEVQEGSSFCGKCGAPVGAAPTQEGAAIGTAGVAASLAPAPKKNGAKIGVIAAAVVVVLLVVIGFATNGFGLGGVQPKEAVDVPAASQDPQAEGSDEGAEGAGEDAASGDAEGQGAAAGATVKSAVEAYTWDELSQISAEIAAAGDEAAGIEVAKKYNLCTPDGKLDGTQVKSVTLTDGTQTTVQIIGFNHDDKTSGAKAGISFIFGDAVGTTDMDASGSNAGGWKDAPVRAWLNSEGVAILPDDLRKLVAPVDKLTNNVGETVDVSAVSTTSDSLWLLSDNEMGAVQDDWMHDGEEAVLGVLDAEGSTYKLFEDMRPEEGGLTYNDALVKQGCVYWWGRTPNPDLKADQPGWGGRAHYFIMVSYDGLPSFTTEANGPGIGVVPGFCI